MRCKSCDRRLTIFECKNKKKDGSSEDLCVSCMHVSLEHLYYLAEYMEADEEMPEDDKDY